MAIQFSDSADTIINQMDIIGKPLTVPEQEKIRTLVEDILRQQRYACSEAIKSRLGQCPCVDEAATVAVNARI